MLLRTVNVTDSSTNDDLIDACPNENITSTTGANTLIIACGALAREIVSLRRLNKMQNSLDIKCLPAILHNTPDAIPEQVREKIHQNKHAYDNIIIGYADCGTGGLLQKMCAEENVAYLDGAHCYAFFTGLEDFDALAEQELGTFYLTDYLARHFDSIVIKSMGLDRYPEMREIMFSHYKRLVYLAQTEDESLTKKAQDSANYLGLKFIRISTGYGELQNFINTAKGEE